MCHDPHVLLWVYNVVETPETPRRRVHPWGPDPYLSYSVRRPTDRRGWEGTPSRTDTLDKRSSTSFKGGEDLFVLNPV